MHKVFVYGTLKRGEPNHHWFGKDESGAWKFISEAKTAEKYPLIIATKYNIPFLLFKPGVGNFVLGEVYEVDDKVLQNLDILEGHPQYYQREQHDVNLIDSSGKNSTKENVWIYFIKSFKPELLERKLYENYKDELDGLKYAERYQRDPTYDSRSEVLA